ncbi:MAG: response regulator transcription factor [Planctomycetes bacterium]|nr:response regulator transcription factor [Planctomycetota bacterium]
MKILIADDEPISLKFLESQLRRWGHETVVARDGQQAWDLFNQDPSLGLAVLDVRMPRIDGLELCRRLRADERFKTLYLIFLTGLADKKDLVEGLDAGANDYVIKPFDPTELRARIAIGERMVNLMHELQRSHAEIRQLATLLPVCAWCRKVRNDDGYWNDLQLYIVDTLGTKITHGICPSCKNEQMKKLTPKKKT